MKKKSNIYQLSFKNSNTELKNYLLKYFPEKFVSAWLDKVKINIKKNSVTLSGSDFYISEIFERHKTGLINFSIEKNKKIMLKGFNPKIKKTTQYIIDKQYCSNQLLFQSL